jgi:hypothetical protein
VAVSAVWSLWEGKQTYSGHGRKAEFDPKRSWDRSFHHVVAAQPHNRHQAYWELENNRLAGFGRLATAKLGERFYTDAVDVLGRNGLELFDLDRLKRPNGRDSVHNMIVKKKITSVFERRNNGDCEYALSDIGTTFEHHFAGKHCLGGKRTSTEALRLWFERLFRLFPNLRFEIHSIAA